MLFFVLLALVVIAGSLGVVGLARPQQYGVTTANVAALLISLEIILSIALANHR